MNLTDKYPANKSNKFFFTKDYMARPRKKQRFCYIAVNEWSEKYNRFIFQDNLNQKVYNTMIDDPSISVFGFMDESQKIERSLANLFINNRILFELNAVGDIIFEEKDADKAIHVLYKTFMMG